MIAKTTRKKITIETVNEELLNSLKEIIETQNKRAIGYTIQFEIGEQFTEFKNFQCLLKEN